MPSRVYEYLPLSGPLAGRSFEQQTIAFFNAIQEQLDALELRLSQCERSGQQDLSIIRTQLAAMQSGITAAQATANKALANTVQKGGIILTGESTVPAGWKLANGQGGTQNLAGYVNPPLKYIQKD